MRMAASGRMRFDTQFFRLPCVPMTTWSTTRSRLHEQALLSQGRTDFQVCSKRAGSKESCW